MPETAAVVERPADAGANADLLRQIVDGDADALTAWFQQYKNSVYALVYYRVGSNADLAADATQSTFLSALERLDDFDPTRGDMATWLRYLSRNIVRDLLKRQRRGHELQAAWDGVDDRLCETLQGIDSAALPDAALERKETRQLVGMTLTNLPPQYRDVLEAKYMNGQSIQAIAAARQTSLDSVRSMLRRARSAFRDHFLAIAGLEMHDV